MYTERLLVELSHDVCPWEGRRRVLSPPGLGGACAGMEDEPSPVLICCSEHGGPTGESGRQGASGKAASPQRRS